MAEWVFLGMEPARAFAVIGAVENVVFPVLVGLFAISLSSIFRAV